MCRRESIHGAAFSRCFSEGDVLSSNSEMPAAATMSFTMNQDARRLVFSLGPSFGLSCFLEHAK